MNKHVNKPWYKKWWGITIIVIGAVGVLSGIAQSTNPQTVKNADGSQQPASQELHAINPYRYDMYTDSEAGIVPSYYALAYDVDINSPDFKQRAKDTVTTIARKLNKQNFAVTFDTDKTCYEFNKNTPDTLDGLSSQEEIDNFRAETKRCGDVHTRSYVVSYNGGINLLEAKADTSENGYLLEFFLNANKNDEVVGKYKEEVKGWKPQI